MVKNVFISWSGDRSRAAAEALRDWLPKVIQASKPWMSDIDIEKGSRGLVEVVKALEGIKLGIICLTSENLTTSWILYEAGALSKTIDEKSRLCTFLLGGLQPQDIRPPLGMFQATRAEKEDTRRLVHAVNLAVSDEPLQKNALDEIFDVMWPQLEKRLAALPEPTDSVDTKRDVGDMVAELLELTRADANRKKKIDRLDEFIPLLEYFLPLFREEINRVAIVRSGAGLGARNATGGLEAPPRMPSPFKQSEES